MSADETGFLGRWSARKRGRDATRENVAGTGSDGDAGAGAGSDVDANATGDVDPFGTHVPGTAPGANDVARPLAVSGSSREPAGADAGSGGESGGGADADTEDEGDARAADDVPVLTDADMPPIESLRSDSDLSAFFSEGVSATLRRAALRRVFAQPAFNVRDGLNDYDGDYTVFEPLGDTITSDMKYHAARHERDRLERERLEQERLALEEEAREREAHAGDADHDDAAEAEADPDVKTSTGTDAGAGAPSSDEASAPGAPDAPTSPAREDGNESPTHA